MCRVVLTLFSAPGSMFGHEDNLKLSSSQWPIEGASSSCVSSYSSNDQSLQKCPPVSLLHLFMLCAHVCHLYSVLFHYFSHAYQICLRIVSCWVFKEQDVQHFFLSIIHHNRFTSFNLSLHIWCKLLFMSQIILACAPSNCRISKNNKDDDEEDYKATRCLFLLLSSKALWPQEVN